MKTTAEYLDAVKTELELPSDYATAKALSVTRAAVSRYRLGQSFPDDLVCARIAEILKVEPMEVIAAVHYERSTDERAKALWESIWGKAAGVTAKALILCAVGLSVAPTSKVAGSGNAGGHEQQTGKIYLMSIGRRRRYQATSEVCTSRLAA